MKFGWLLTHISKDQFSILIYTDFTWVSIASMMAHIELGWTLTHNNTWNLNGVLLTTTTTTMEFIYASISPQHMEFKATDITKLDAI